MTFPLGGGIPYDLSDDERLFAWAALDGNEADGIKIGDTCTGEWVTIDSVGYTEVGRFPRFFGSGRFFVYDVLDGDVVDVRVWDRQTGATRTILESVDPDQWWAAEHEPFITAIQDGEARVVSLASGEVVGAAGTVAIENYWWWPDEANEFFAFVGGPFDTDLCILGVSPFSVTCKRVGATRAELQPTGSGAFYHAGSSGLRSWRIGEASNSLGPARYWTTTPDGSLAVAVGSTADTSDVRIYDADGLLRTLETSAAAPSGLSFRQDGRYLIYPIPGAEPTARIEAIDEDSGVTVAVGPGCHAGDGVDRAFAIDASGRFIAHWYGCDEPRELRLLDRQSGELRTLGAATGFTLHEESARLAVWGGDFGFRIYDLPAGDWRDVATQVGKVAVLEDNERIVAYLDASWAVVRLDGTEVEVEDLGLGLDDYNPVRPIGHRALVIRGDGSLYFVGLE